MKTALFYLVEQCQGAADAKYNRCGGQTPKVAAATGVNCRRPAVVGSALLGRCVGDVANKLSDAFVVKPDGNAARLNEDRDAVAND
jgi:hypothetical protein